MLRIQDFHYYDQMKEAHEHLMELARKELSQVGDTNNDPYQMDYEELVQTYAPRAALGVVHHPREVTRLMDIHYALVQLERAVTHFNLDSKNDGGSVETDELKRACTSFQRTAENNVKEEFD